MRRHIRILAVASVAVGLLGGVTPLVGVAVGAAAPTTTPTRFVRQVCAALNTWDDKASTDDSGPEKALNANKKSPKSTRQAVWPCSPPGEGNRDTDHGDEAIGHHAFRTASK